MPDDDVTAELERLRAENAQLKRAASQDMTLKVSEKGGLSVYGRFPVTLYKEQWTTLFDMIRRAETALKVPLGSPPVPPHGPPSRRRPYRRTDERR
jgi:hypothetical protein